MLHAVIMAGGSGTRFWPASRARWPKQLLDLGLGRTMIQATADRLHGLVDETIVITNRDLVAAIRQQLPDLTEQQVIGEPCKRDTAPCIGLAALLVSRVDPDATMLVLPADHVIRTDAQFHASVRAAQRLIAEDPQRIVTFGIRPTYPAEIFGYIERGEPLVYGMTTATEGQPDSLPPAFQAQRFREKPNATVAREYLASGNFYWNSGIFVWSAATILDALREWEPRMFERLVAIGEAFGKPNFAAALEREFTAIEGKSIDYAVMERYPRIAVLEAPFSWDDVGNWRAVARLQGHDDEGNAISGRHLGIRTHNTIVRTDDEHLVVTLGLEDMIVIHTPDATLVARANDEEALREVVKTLAERGWDRYL